MNMQKFSVSKALIRHGVPPKKQGLIYYTCINSDGDDKLKDKIKSLCDDVAAQHSEALYVFLTNPYVNHSYICMNYDISRDKLFELKRKFYKKWE